MSSILKALKKLEHEKTVRKPYSLRLDAEILQGGITSRSFSAGASLAAIALFLCGVGATYLFMKHDKAPVPVQTSQTSINRVKSEPSTGSTVIPVSDTPATGPKPVKAISAPPNPRSMEKQQDQRVKPAEIEAQVATPEPKPVSPPVLPVAPVAVVPPAKPVLKVNGIAFQDGSDSVAVVNGTSVSIGSVIEGAKVEEIQKDRVKFSRGGEKFDIILDKSN